MSYTDLDFSYSSVEKEIKIYKFTYLTEILHVKICRLFKI